MIDVYTNYVSTAIVHHGALENIPEHRASPGILFLKHFLPIFDSLSPKLHPSFPSFLHPNCLIHCNLLKPTPLIWERSNISVTRNEELWTFHRKMLHVYEIQRPAGFGKPGGCTVIFECVLVMQGRGEHRQKFMKQINMFELEEFGSRMRLCEVRSTYLSPLSMWNPEDVERQMGKNAAARPA